MRHEQLQSAVNTDDQIRMKASATLGLLSAVVLVAMSLAD
jgi:hypothetical protein